MPAYDWTCPKCGTFEITKGMRDPDPKKCPRCGAKDIVRVFNTRIAFIPPIDSSWHLENGGRGRHIAQIGDENEPLAYARARHEIPDNAKRAGFTKIEKC